MIYPTLVLLAIALSALILISFRQPDLLQSASFPFTRKCLGVAILSVVVSVASQGCAIWYGELALGIAIVANVVGGFALICAYRGIFEILAKR